MRKKVAILEEELAGKRKKENLKNLKNLHGKKKENLKIERFKENIFEVSDNLTGRNILLEENHDVKKSARGKKKTRVISGEEKKTGGKISERKHLEKYLKLENSPRLTAKLKLKKGNSSPKIVEKIKPLIEGASQLNIY